MRCDQIRIITTGDHAELRARVERTGAAEPFELWFRFPRAYRRHLRADDATPFLAALMLPAMRTGEALELEALVSSRVLARVEDLMRIYSTWWPAHNPVPIVAQARARVRSPLLGRPSASFFTLGVDSYHTLLKNLDGAAAGTPPIRSLIFITGYDVLPDNLSLLPEIERNLERAALATGTSLLPVSTNLREFTNPLVRWADYHGTALAAVALALERAFEAVYIASSCSFDDLFPWGSHPLSDPLWSSERMRLIHDGCELRRTAKAALVARVPVVQQTLRCCWENRDGAYNCGQCEKCLRTMGALVAADALGAVSTFPSEYPLAALNRIDWSDERVRTRFGKVLEALPDDERCRPLRDALLSYTEPFDPNAPQP